MGDNQWFAGGLRLESHQTRVTISNTQTQLYLTDGLVYSFPNTAAKMLGNAPTKGGDYQTK